MAKAKQAEITETTEEPLVIPWGAWDEKGTHTTMGTPEAYFANIRCPECGTPQNVNPVPDDGVVNFACSDKKCAYAHPVKIENWETDIVP